MSSKDITIGAFSLKHKEHHDIIISAEWYIFVLQQVPKDFLPCHLFSTCLYFTVRVTFVTQYEKGIGQVVVVVNT